MSHTQERMAIRTSSEPLTSKYKVMFDRPIEESNEFHEEFYIMEQAGEGDLVNVHVDTNGGATSTVSTFQMIKAKSPAHFHGVLQGKAFSAGSAIFLLCDTHEVADLGEMMIHTTQQGMSGHSDESQEFGNQTARTARKFMEFIYKDFLTQEEIEQCLIGKSFWLDSDQIKERLALRNLKREQQAIEDMKSVYTPEVYAEQIALDILEDCENFNYDVLDIVKKVMEYIEINGEVDSDEYTEVGDLVTINKSMYEIAVADKNSTEFKCVYAALKEVAHDNGIPVAHNIGIEKLLERVKDFVEFV